MASCTTKHLNLKCYVFILWSADMFYICLSQKNLQMDLGNLEEYQQTNTYKTPVFQVTELFLANKKNLCLLVAFFCSNVCFTFNHQTYWSLFRFRYAMGALIMP